MIASLLWPRLALRRDGVFICSVVGAELNARCSSSVFPAMHGTRHSQLHLLHRWINNLPHKQNRTGMVFMDDEEKRSIDLEDARAK
jgi:hypothetical protein